MAIETTGELRQIEWEVYRGIDRDGWPKPGESGLTYPDGSARQGYQIVPESVAATIRPGERINYGTTNVTVPIADPRPAFGPGNYGPGLKLVSANWGTVTRIGPPYRAIVDRCVDDEDGSTSGLRVVARHEVAVCNLYFSRD